MKQCLDEKVLSKEERNRLVEENINLVRHIVFEKFNIPYNEADNAISDGAFGLFKAAATYDPTKGIKFSTYAGRCITNEILMAMRREKKHKHVISLEEPLRSDNEGNTLTFTDTLCSKETDPFEKIELRRRLECTVNILLNYFSDKSRISFLYFLSGMNQNDIADKLGISQSYVSRIIKKVQSKLKSYVEGNVILKKHEEVIQMTIPNERFYQFNFSSSDIRQFNKIFARLLENSNNSGKIPTFQLVCNNNRVQIRLEAEEKSFAFLAQIIQEIDNFKLSFVSNVEVDSEEEESKVGETNSLPAEETHEDNNTNLEESERKQEVFEDTEMLSDKDLQETTSSNVTSSINLGREGTITKKILTFISSQDTFRVADLNKEFPDCKVQLLQYVLRKAKKENLITMISKGKYKVNH